MTISNLRRVALAGVMGALGLAAAPAEATNGYFANGYGGGSKGMAGAGVAVKTGVLGLAQNPAMGVALGNSAGFCLTTFNPSPRGFTIGPTSFESENDIFLIPCGGANFKLNDRSAIGVFIYGNGGMNTEYKANPFALGGGTAPYGVNLEQLFVSANYSFEVNEQLSIGIGPTFALQRFSATGLEAFIPFSIDPTGTKVTNNGDSWSSGVGLNLGIAYSPNENWTFGAAYRTKFDMDEFGKYAGLFAEGGDFDIPAVATVGAAYTPPSNPKLTLTGEYQRIFYGDVASLANSGALLTTPLGAANGPGFGWKDMDVYRIAAIMQANDRLTLRTGVSYSSSFIDSTEVLLNTLAPATPQWHASVGFSYKLQNGWGVTGSYTHAFKGKKSGANLTPGYTFPVTLEMEQDELALGITKKW